MQPATALSRARRRWGRIVGRSFLGLILLLAFVLACAAVYNHWAFQHYRAVYPPPGKLYRVDGPDEIQGMLEVTAQFLRQLVWIKPLMTLGVARLAGRCGATPPSGMEAYAGWYQADNYPKRTRRCWHTAIPWRTWRFRTAAGSPAASRRRRFSSMKAESPMSSARASTR